ncbi:MAG: 6-carboxytetrahydropterin synthase QueD [Candidatus Obscuribacterales bacterium]|nr:6-carboxytetrahydropterin synthase QueD [Candidatus Obscuribacterales bacterium]
MYQIAKELHFCYGHRLMNHNGKCKRLHGHNAKVLITVEAENLDSDGMLMDFSDLKRDVSNWIDEKFDHQMLLHKDDPIVAALTASGEPFQILEVHPTAENLAHLIFDFVKDLHFPVVDVTLWETNSCFARYSA